jgi:AraC family transcriptional regulator, arabinose operon regulatory protein
VRELARETGYSPDHFSRVFKQVTGQTPQALKVQARLERARQLLTESSLSISMIANALGYEDVFFFSRQFKEKTGRTPTAYRKGGPA